VRLYEPELDLHCLALPRGSLLAWLAGEPAGTGELAGLTELAVKLRACDGARVPISTRSGSKRFAY